MSSAGREFPDDDSTDETEAELEVQQHKTPEAEIEVDVNEQMWQAAFNDDLAAMEAALRSGVAAGANPNDIDPGSRFTILQVIEADISKLPHVTNCPTRFTLSTHGRDHCWPQTAIYRGQVGRYDA